ncbi:MAG: hypothetical protein RM368_23755 [Nostoc sp. DedSLP03]|uniref:hypothetical protein n=1 Tax=Nostoc sp. DedSLP03 TaxID=3075400 RepID=UPI002AD33809|nr:hypothetical protein [Nostoc sp. DedSLP03]MDZ7967935.1 hypothetical protein [Nostoc sp. DedSLP03]
MGDSLLPYLELKIHPILKLPYVHEVKVIGKYDRSQGISPQEKSGKLFNFKRPTVVLNDEIAEVRCFPGWDYVFHFSNVIACYFKNIGRDVHVVYSLPTVQECWNVLRNSSLQELPCTEVVILGYVEGLDFLSEDKKWQGDGDFLWKICKFGSCQTLLLGCKHTYWGEIAGRIVMLLAERGVKTVIYSGKLGSLDMKHTPNSYLATGGSSYMPGGELISWENAFDCLDDPIVQKGLHTTIASVLQETVIWHEQQPVETKFVDPEIGHMAFAASVMNIKFSYLHIISDNLSAKYSFDLSNERNEKVLEDRRNLYRIIGAALSVILAQCQ